MKTAAVRIGGEITPEGHLRVELPPALPSGPVVVTLEPVPPEGVEENGHNAELRALAEEWKSGRGPTSSALEAAMHPAYLRIIAKGYTAVPFLLRELQRSPDHWFLALMAITGEDPVAEESHGDMKAMAAAWVEWGKRANLH